MMGRPHDVWTRLWATLNRSPGVLLAGITALYLAITVYQAAFRLLWVDELITYSIASQGSVRAIWHALVLGADPNPPLIHIAVLASVSLFGQSALAIRLPSVLGMLVAIFALWAILRRWLQPVFAALGVLAFMCTRGFDYAYEARSYAPLTAFTMAALACWLVTPGSSRPRQPTRRDSLQRAPLRRVGTLLPSAAVAICLAAAVSSNYYGVLAWFPIAVGEVVLTAHTRRLRPATWLALAAATLPLIAYLPLIRHNLTQFTPHAWNRPNVGMVTESYLVLVEGVLWPVLFASLYLAWTYTTRRLANTRTNLGALPHPQPNVPAKPLPHEAAALVTLLLYPVFALLLAYAGASIVSPRCALPVCCGFGVAAALLAGRLLPPDKPRAGVLLLCAALVWVVGRQSACALILATQRTAFLALRDRLTQTPDDDPILLADFNLSLPLAHYGRPELRSRLLFPIDFAAIHAAEPNDSGEQNLWAGRNGIFPIRILPYTYNLATTPAVILSRPNGWLADSLSRDGASLRDITTPADTADTADMGGVFTPLAYDSTRLFASLPHRRNPE